MSNTKNCWDSASWFCSNCGCPTEGNYRKDKSIKIKCPKCLTVTINKMVEEGHYISEVFIGKNK